jgi:serine/arginine repetitive matrix protein 2
MIGGGYVRRQSLGSVFDGSPCARVEKRQPLGTGLAMESLFAATEEEEDPPTPTQALAPVSQPAEPILASPSPMKFGGDRMTLARNGQFQRQSLEITCLSADGEFKLPSCK